MTLALKTRPSASIKPSLGMQNMHNTQEQHNKASAEASQGSPTTEKREYLGKGRQSSDKTPDAMAQKDDSVVNKYLSIVSKLENALERNSLSEQELGQILSKLEARIAALPPKVREKLRDLPEYKALQLSSIKNLQQELKVQLQDPLDRQAVFAFLKSKTFIAALKGDPLPSSTANTYTAQSIKKSMSAAAPALRPMSASAASSESAKTKPLIPAFA